MTTAPGDDDVPGMVRRLRQGDRTALDRLVDRFDGRLYGFLLVLTGDGHRAADIAQDAWMRVMTHHAQLRDEASFLPWLLRIAQRAWFRSGRRRRATALDDAPPVAAEGHEVTELLVRSEDAAAVRKAVADLPPERRAVLWLAVVEGWSHAQIAATLDIPEGTARSRLHYTLDGLRRTLAGRTP